MGKWKIATFNVNSVRARTAMLVQWLTSYQPDVLCLQETKVQDDQFPLQDFQAIGYHAAICGRKSYNGVAILSRKPATQVRYNLDEWGEEGEARLITAHFDDIVVVNTYVPQGRDPQTPYFQYKLAWLRHMRDYFERYFTPTRQLVWVGDLNVAPQAIDVYDPKRLLGHCDFHPDEHQAFQYVQDWGLVDVFRRHIPDGGQYTFWDYRVPNALKRGLGWRIDHILATPPLADLSVRCWIDTDLRQQPKSSDHTPLIAEFELP